jgi:hypothetical protein
MQNSIRSWLKQHRIIVTLIVMIDCLIIAVLVGSQAVLAQNQWDMNPPTTNRPAVVEGILRLATER